MKRWSCLWLLVSVAVIAGPSRLLFAAERGAEAGKAVYQKKCASCHGKMGEGNPAVAKTLKVELRHLGSKEIQAKSDGDLRKVITEGTRKKKPVKGLSEDDLANVIAYLRTLAKR